MAEIIPFPRAMGLAPARAETPQAAQGRSPAGPATRDSAAGAHPSTTILHDFIQQVWGNPHPTISPGKYDER
jgi:hypothetical protein